MREAFKLYAVPLEENIVRDLFQIPLGCEESIRKGVMEINVSLDSNISGSDVRFCFFQGQETIFEIKVEVGSVNLIA